MARDGKATKERIMREAEALIFEHGLSGTSVDQIIERAGVTKGAFFHHFKSKGVLAKELMEKASADDMALISSSIERAEKLSSDPLQQVLICVGLIREVVDSLDAPPPGCLFASMNYQRLEVPFDMDATAQCTFETWRRTLGDKLAAAKKLHVPDAAFEPYDLADHFTTIFEGALVMYRLFDDPAFLTKSMDIYRDLVSGYFGVLETQPNRDAAE